MRKLILLIVSSSITILSFSQKTEWHISAGSGAFFFSGRDVVQEQDIFSGSINHPPLSIPYGNRPGFSQMAGISLKRITKRNFLFGIGAEFQSLSANSKIDKLISFSSYSGYSMPQDAPGKSIFRGNYITLSPLFGARCHVGKNSLDLTTGPAFAFLLSSNERLKYKTTGIPAAKNSFKKDLNNPVTDFRLQVSLDWHVKRMTVFTGYAKGLSNYYRGINDYNPKAFSNFIKLGASYRLN